MVAVTDQATARAQLVPLLLTKFDVNRPITEFQKTSPLLKIVQQIHWILNAFINA